MTFIPFGEDGTIVPNLFVEDTKPLETEHRGPSGDRLWWVADRVGFHNPLGEQPYDLKPYD
jgi:hypothetical protein